MKTFNELNINKELIEKLKKQGIKNPTPIQEQSIPYIKNKKDIIGEAQTGTGKTLAFLLPILENLEKNNKMIQTLILTPTRELAIQISEVIESLNKDKQYKYLTIYGGKDISNQIEDLKQEIKIVIGTPGRILDHIKRKTIDLSKIKTLVLDEADQMIFLGFKNEVEEILPKLAKKRQTLCFSATMDSSVKKLAYKITNNPISIKIESEEKILDNINQFLIKTTDRQKRDMLCQILNKTNPFMGIIFCRTKVRVDALEKVLSERGYSCQKIHSDIIQSKREKIIKAFKNAEFQYLVATDVASRGLDINGVTHVYNFDIPENVETYIHRIGRTGRAGEKGETYMFVDPKDTVQLQEIEKEIKIEITRLELEHVSNTECNYELPKLKYNKKIKTTSKKK